MAEAIAVRREDLILKIRYQALKSNLKRVRDLNADLEKRKKQVDEVAQAIETAYNFLLEAESNLLELNKKLRLGGDITPKEIRSIADQARSVSELLEGPKASVENLQAVCKYLSPQAAEMSISKVLDAGVPAGENSWVSKLDQLYEKVLSTPATARTDAWDAYRRDLHSQSQQLFRDYVELLGGLAVRDMELDQKICRFADELLKRYALATAEGRLLTIPTRQEAVRMTWSRVVRLGFPEWSIWALPCTAHELWFVIARARLKQDPRLENLNAREDLCLADAFATWTVGPAYGYACILLQLNPYPAIIDGVEHPADDDRVAAITYMLNRMGSQGMLNRYESVVKKLKMAWADAQQRDDSTAPVASNESNERIDALFHRLNEDLIAAQFSADNWDRFQKWPDLLQQGKTDTKQYEEFGTADARWVLNAAWQARVSNLQSTGNIETAATKLLETIYPEKSLKSRQTAPGA